MINCPPGNGHRTSFGAEPWCSLNTKCSALERFISPILMNECKLLWCRESIVRRAPCASRAFKPASHIQRKQMPNKRKWLMSSVVSPLSASNDMLHTGKFPQKTLFFQRFSFDAEMDFWLFDYLIITSVLSEKNEFPHSWVLKLFRFWPVPFIAIVSSFSQTHFRLAFGYGHRTHGKRHKHKLNIWWIHNFTLAGPHDVRRRSFAKK